MIRALFIGILSTAALAACATTSPAHPSSRTAASAARPGGCCSPTQVYSGKQLRETGRTDVGHALQMLDPSVTVHGN